MLVLCEDADREPKPCLALILPLTGAEAISKSADYALQCFEKGQPCKLGRAQYRCKSTSSQLHHHKKLYPEPLILKGPRSGRAVIRKGGDRHTRVFERLVYIHTVAFEKVFAGEMTLTRPEDCRPSLRPVTLYLGLDASFKDSGADAAGNMSTVCHNELNVSLD